MSEANTTSKSDLANVAQKLGLPLVETERLVDLVAADMLRSLYRYPHPIMVEKKGPDGKAMHNADGVVLREEKMQDLSPGDLEHNKKVEGVYRAWYNSDFPQYSRKIRSTALLGPPGHGKTTSMEVAAKRVANAMGMRYLDPSALERVEIDDIDKNTFVFVSQETAGIVSAMEWMGLPTAEQDKLGEKHMGRLFSPTLIKLMKAGGGVLLFDDFLNASRQIQDVGLSITDRRRYNRLDLSNAYIGVTGNLGSLDGTNASRASAALRNRMRMFMAYDNVDNFVARIQADPAYRDELGDGFIRMFLHRYPNYFSEYPKADQQGGYTTPRSLKDFIDEVRDTLQRFGGRKNAKSAREEIYLIAQSMLGLDVANAFNSYCDSLFNKADPLARQVIIEGKMSIEEVRESYKEGGFSAKEQHFGYQFAMALVDYAVNKVVEDQDMKVAIERFGTGMLALDDSLFAFAVEQLSVKLSAQVEHLSKSDMKVSSQIDKNSKRRELTMAAREEIGKLILNNPAAAANSKHRAILVSVLSDMNKHEARAGSPPPMARPTSRQAKR